MVGDTTGPKRSYEEWHAALSGQAKAAFDKTHTGPSDQKTAETKAAETQSHAPKPALTLEMKGPGGDAVRRQNFQEKQDQLRKVAETRKPEDIQKMVSQYNRQNERDMVKSKDADERGR